MEYTFKYLLFSYGSTIFSFLFSNNLFPFHIHSTYTCNYKKSYNHNLKARIRSWMLIKVTLVIFEADVDAEKLLWLFFFKTLRVWSLKDKPEDVVVLYLLLLSHCLRYASVCILCIFHIFIAAVVAHQDILVSVYQCATHFARLKGSANVSYSVFCISIIHLIPESLVLTIIHAITIFFPPSQNIDF